MKRRKNAQINMHEIFLGWLASRNEPAKSNDERTTHPYDSVRGNERERERERERGRRTRRRKSDERNVASGGRAGERAKRTNGH